MTPNPVTVEPWDPIWAAADLMAVHQVNRLPVVDDLGPNALEITVARGVVTIRGEIDSELASTCLRKRIHLVPGVVQVD